MNALAEAARKELRRRRLSTVTIFCVACLVLLAGAYLLPRDYTASATLVLDHSAAVDQGLPGRLQGQLESGAALPEHAVRIERIGGKFEVHYTAHSPQHAFDGLSGLLARLVSEERTRLLGSMRKAEGEILQQVDEAQQGERQAESALRAALAALPEGGESALGARIGKLQGELDAVQVDIRSARELQKSLTRRAAELRSQVSTLQPALAELDEVEGALRRLRAAPDRPREDAIADLEERRSSLLSQHPRLRETLQMQLEPQLKQVESRIATLRDEIAAKERRQTDLQTLLEQAHAETSSMQQGNQAIRELQRRYDDAVAARRQLAVRLQDVRLDMDLRTNAAALPFSISRLPAPPRRPDGIPAWACVLLAMLGALVVAALRLLGSMLVDDKVRLAETVLEEAEVPVLAVIPEYRPRDAVARVRVRVVLVAMLVAATVLAMALFLMALG